MKVMKFGGTSVKDDEAIKRVAKIIKSVAGGGVVVVSALSGVTNSLVKVISSLREGKRSDAVDELQKIRIRHQELAQKLKLNNDEPIHINGKIAEMEQLINALDVLGEVSPKSADKILSLGEDFSSYLIFRRLLADGLKIHYADSRSLIKTDSNFNEANVDFRLTKNAIRKNLAPILDGGSFAITQGFVAASKEGQTTTLGRGGSDYSASVIASSLDVEALEIWTDVNGIMTSDPRFITGSRQILKLSYDEASELAYFGAKVLHPKTIYPAIKQNIPVYVLNSFSPENSGTLIHSGKSRQKMIKAIAFRKGVTVISIHSNRMLGAYGFLNKVFEVFGQYETSVDIVTTSEVSISLTIDDDSSLDKIMLSLRKFATIDIKRDRAIIAAVGEGIRDTAGIAARFFGVLKGVNISMVSIGASEVNISIIVDEKDLIRAVQLLHNEFLSNVKNSEIFSKIRN